MKSLPEHIDGVLFDLDGTLLDSAPDLYTALLRVCEEQGAAAPAYASVRQVVSGGGLAILKAGFPARDEESLRALLPGLLAHYQAHIAVDSRPFDGVPELLGALESAGLPWGIVTNKAAYLAERVLAELGWASRVAALVAGDTLSVKKPDPAPVLLACRQAGLEPAQTLFVGDDRRDVLAGNAAGLFTVVVDWGYLAGGDPAGWGADLYVSSPAELVSLTVQGIKAGV